MTLGLLALLTSLTYCRGDYPQRDLYYSQHRPEFYPTEVFGTSFCDGLSDGDYQHYNFDFGDPRCTFVSCSNKRVIIHACPTGTRTAISHQMAQPVLLDGAPYRPSLVPLSGTKFELPNTVHQAVCTFFDVLSECASAAPYNFDNVKMDSVKIFETED